MGKPRPAEHYAGSSSAVSRDLPTGGTSYRGKHFIEAYVIKNGRVVATDHYEVHVN